MSGRLDKFRRWLIEAGMEPDEDLPRPRPEDLAAAGLTEEVDAVYRALGGALETPPGARLGPWSVALDGIAVEQRFHTNCS